MWRPAWRASIRRAGPGSRHLGQASCGGWVLGWRHHARHVAQPGCPAFPCCHPTPNAEQEVRLLQCAIKYEAGDLRGCRAALEALPPGGPAAAATAGCLAYKEGRWAEAAARFGEAMQMVRL